MNGPVEAGISGLCAVQALDVAVLTDQSMDEVAALVRLRASVTPTTTKPPREAAAAFVRQLTPILLL